MSMRIESKALVANLLILFLLLGLVGGAQYTTLRGQIGDEAAKLQQSVELLLDPELKLTAIQRANAIRNLPGSYSAEIVDSKGKVVGDSGSGEEPAASHSIWTTLGLSAPQMMVEGSGLKVTVTLDVLPTHTRAVSQALTLLLGWLVLVAISLFWLRSSVQRPLRKSLGEISHLLDRIARRDQGELRVGEGIASEFRSLTDGLRRLQQDLLGRLSDTEQQLTDVKRLAYTDQLTELPNRALFMEEMPQLLADRTGREFGQLALLRTGVLGELNREHGYSHGDNFVVAVVASVRETLSRFPRVKAYRLNSSDIALVMVQTGTSEAHELIKVMVGRLEEVSLAYSVSRCANIGVIPYGPDRSVGELLAQADAATSRARNSGSGYLFSEQPQATEGLGEQKWRDEIDHLLAQRQITMLRRTITALRENRNLRELMPRFTAKDGSELAPGALYGMAERLGRAEALDQLVLDQALAAMRSSKDPLQTIVPLSGFSVHSSPFIANLERLLARDKNLAAQLVLAVSEGVLQRDAVAASRFIETVHRLGARVLVDDFGHGVTSFLFFRDLKPDFVRLAPSFATDAEQDKNVQYFVRLLVDVCHRVTAKVIASGVDSQGQRYAMEGLTVDLLCGDYVAQPQLVAVAG